MAFFSKKRISLWGLLVAGSFLPAQTPDTIIKLDEVVVSVERLALSLVGNREDRLDSVDLAIHQRQNLADLLALQSTIFIKNYGPSNSATSALRGAASAHTPVLWNGFNLQSPMLGQVDLSLLPLLFADEVRIQYGGGSALWGSGPIGGAIHLNNHAHFGHGPSWQVGGSLGSFGHYRASVKGTVSARRFVHTSRAFFLNGENNFTFERAPGDRRQMTNARNRQYGFMQENHFRLGQNQRMGLYAWYQKANRQLPPTTLQENAEATQSDDLLRLMAHWSRYGEKLLWQTRLAVFRENLFYKDPAFSYAADNTAWTTLAETEGHWRLNAQNQVAFGINATWITANSDSYTETRRQDRTALFAAYRWNDAPTRWRGVLSLRQELVDAAFSPFVPSLGLERRLGENLQVTASISRNYRLPAMNDLYFFGGNPDLEAERGWSQELGLGWQKTRGNMQFRYQFTGFNRNVSNWIVWLPNADFTVWSPRNIRKVWSRGVEQTFLWRTEVENWRVQLEVRHDYLQATNEEVEKTGAPFLGKQLIYTPKQRIMAGVELGRRQWSIRYYHQYTDRVFTLEDHTAHLPAYHLGALVARYDHTRGQLYFRINNLGDKNYQVVQFYPQPGRHFELGATWMTRGAARTNTGTKL